ncbi:shikimate kinase [Natranaerobius trueperi]|uniref:shikimate kinase n=1 Tax=Natranaerobius trueperi TaxID=759412 RepID=UPI001303010D|nr:shikimate kinase [Natranaerobius trueperi]
MTLISLDKNIALIGFMGVGKSTIGCSLAKSLGIGFKDTDKQIEKETNMDIANIFKMKGEQWFRDIESIVLTNLISDGPYIIATGGGIVERSINRQILKNQTITVSLLATAETICQRVILDNNRPLLNTENKLQEIERLLNLRLKYYYESDILVWTDTLTRNQVKDKIIDELKYLK